MHISLRAAVVASTLSAVATPASATLWLVQGSGTMFQTPTPGFETRLEGVPFNDQPISFSLTIDDSVTPFDNPPPGGVGQSRTYPGAVVGFSLTIGSATITRKAGAPSSLLLVNDGAIGSSSRIDQLSYFESVQSIPNPANPPLLQFLPWFETDAALPADAFITGFNFGRSVTTTAPDVPGLLTSADLPPLDSVWQPHPTQMFLNLDVRAGTPTTVLQFARLPRARFSASQLQFTVQRLSDTPAIPEPASWALMIAGFGLVGAALRRRPLPA